MTGRSSKTPGSLRSRGVDEDHAGGTADRLHQLGRKLMKRQDFDLGIGDNLAETFGGNGTDGVIAAEGVAVADDEYS